jgi:hypothetical protein
MPLLTSNQPLSVWQRRTNWAALLFLSLAGVGLGLWNAHDVSFVTSGYAAAYTYGAVFFFGIFLLMAGSFLLVYWRTRWFGWGLIAAGILSYLSLCGGVAVLTKLDRVSWKHEQMVRFGPDQKASVVIYFRKQVTNEQVEDFNRSVLMVPSVPQHDGPDYPAFVSEYLRLLPTQANGYNAVAIGFFDNSPADKVKAYLALIKADNRVERVFLDTAPDAIRIDSKHP